MSFAPVRAQPFDGRRRRVTIPIVAGPSYDPTREPADTRDRIAAAERALAGFRALMRTLPNARDVDDAGRRREAIALARRDGAETTLERLLLLEAAPSAVARTVPDGAIDARGAAVLALGYLEMLRAGCRQIDAEGSLTGEILLALLGRLREISRARHVIPSIGIVELRDALRAAKECTSPIVGAFAAQHHLTLAPPTPGEHAALGRITALLLLRGCGGSFVSLPASDVADIGAFADANVASVAATTTTIDRCARVARENARTVAALSKASHSALLVHRALQRYPIIDLRRLLIETGLGAQAATSALHRLRALGIVRALTRRHRYRIYSYDAYIEALGGGDSRDEGSVMMASADMRTTIARARWSL
jgi:hypothetical protein